MGEPFEDLGLVFELGSYSVDLLVFEPQLLTALNRTSTLHTHIRVHHHCCLKPRRPIIFKFHCKLFLRIAHIILVKIIVEVIARILSIVHLLKL